MKPRSLIVAIGSVAFVASAAAADLTPEMRAVVAAANKEGTVNLTWNPRTLGGTKGAKRLEKEMNALFGSKIDIRYTPGPSIPTVGNKLAMEYQAKRKAHTDIWLGSARAIATMVKRDIYLTVPWGKMLPSRLTDAVVDLDGKTVKLVTILPAITYNTKLAPFKPTSLADMLKPEWKGKIASTPYVANFDMLSGLWGLDKAVTYAKALSGQIAGLMRCNENGRLASGEFLALVTDCNSQNALISKGEGLPVDSVIPSDFPVVAYFYLSVVKHAPNPNAAKLVIAYLATEQGQKFAWDTWKADLHLYPESRMRRSMAGVLAGGKKLTDVTPEWHLAHPDARKGWVAIRKIMASKKKR